MKVAKRTPCPPLPRAGEGWGEGNREWRDCFHVPGWRERHERLACGRAQLCKLQADLYHGQPVWMEPQKDRLNENRVQGVVADLWKTTRLPMPTTPCARRIAI